MKNCLENEINEIIHWIKVFHNNFNDFMVAVLSVNFDWRWITKFVTHEPKVATQKFATKKKHFILLWTFVILRYKKSCSTWMTLFIYRRRTQTLKIKKNLIQIWLSDILFLFVWFNFFFIWQICIQMLKWMEHVRIERIKQNSENLSNDMIAWEMNAT